MHIFSFQTWYSYTTSINYKATINLELLEVAKNQRKKIRLLSLPSLYSTDDDAVKQLGVAGG